MTLPGKKPSERGFTLLEMTMALVLSMGIAFVIIGLLQQQVSFSRALADFCFNV